MKCQYECGGLISRCRLTEHEQDECPQRPMDVKIECLMRKMEQRHMGEVAAIREEIKEMDKAHTTEITEMEKKNRALTAEIATMKEEMKDKDKVLAAEIAKVERKNEALVAEMAEIEKKNRALTAEMNELKQLLKKLRKEIKGKVTHSTKYQLF